jgi:hypothetical protein
MGVLVDDLLQLARRPAPRSRRARAEGVSTAYVSRRGSVSPTPRAVWISGGLPLSIFRRR